MIFKKLCLISLTLASTGAARADEFAARNCEAFVDKAVHVIYKDRRITRSLLKLYVKILPERLDGEVKGAVLYVRDLNERGAPRAVEMKRFAADYYEVSLGMTHSDSNTTNKFHGRYAGAIYVETSKGTRYWINPAGGGDFTFDENLTGRLRNRHDPGPVSWSAREVDVKAMIKTAEVEAPSSESYLNPDSCR